MAIRPTRALRRVTAHSNETRVLPGRHRTFRTIVALGTVALIGVVCVSPAAATQPNTQAVAVPSAVSQDGLTVPAGVDLSALLFMSGDVDPSRAAHWSWCTPVRWTVDTSNIDKSGVKAAQEMDRWQRAVAQIAAVAGYEFSYVPTAPGSAAHAPDELPSVPGVDIVISYGSATDAGGYRDSNLASRRQVAATVLKWLETDAGVKQTLAAWVTFDYTDLDTLAQSRSYRPADRIALMSHELGHAMGLGHINDPRSMMFAEWLPKKKDLSPIDIAGLVQLAQQPCAEIPAEHLVP